MRAVVIALLIFITAFSQTKTRKVGTKKLTDEPARKLQAGDTQLKARNYNKALVEYEAAIKELDAYKTKSDEDLPEKYRNKSVIDDYLVKSLYRAGKSAGGASKFKEADAYFDRAIKIGSESTKAWYEYGNYLFSRNKTSAAKNALTNVNKIGEANLAKETNKKKKAKILRDMAQANYKLGRATQNSNAKKAAAYYERAAELKKNYYQPLLFLTKLHEEQKKWKAMLNSSTRLIAAVNAQKKKNTKRKQLPKATLLKGIAEYNLKQYKAATRTLDAISKMNRVKKSDKNASFYYIGMSYKKMNNKNKAITFFQKTKGAFKSSADYEIDDIKNGHRYTN